MPNNHQVKLSNGQTLLIEEGDGCVKLATMERARVDYYICEISADGVLTLPNSGSATHWLTKGLKTDDE